MKIEQKKLLQQEPRLIERYIRLQMFRYAKRVSRFIMRRVLNFKERERKRAVAIILSEFAKQIAKNRKYGFESSAVLLNLGLFFLIADRDIQSVKIDALTHPDPWKRSLCSRIILLTIHELDMDKVAGGKLRSALENAGVSEEAKRQATQALRSIRGAQKNAQNKFAFLRNATIAHRDQDALLQYQSITQIDEMEVLRIASDFYNGTRLFLDVLPNLVLQVGTFPGLINQLKASSDINAEKLNT
ncbi:MAG: Con-6 family protein [Formivibrio sp.]|nr:Con-6 family protein [Formivibrio sp.]